MASSRKLNFDFKCFLWCSGLNILQQEGFEPTTKGLKNSTSHNANAISLHFAFDGSFTFHISRSFHRYLCFTSFTWFTLPLLPPMSIKPRYSLGWQTLIHSILFLSWYILVVKYILYVNMFFLLSSKMVLWVLQAPGYQGSRLTSRSLPSVAYTFSCWKL